MPLTDTTRRRVRRNHERVRSLIGLAGMMIHTAAEEDMGQDVLRAATVLLHASLDDFMRTVAKENWSSLSQERLKSVPFPSRKPGEKISFLDLLQVSPSQIAVSLLTLHRKSVGSPNSGGWYPVTSPPTCALQRLHELGAYELTIEYPAAALQAASLARDVVFRSFTPSPDRR